MVEVSPRLPRELKGIWVEDWLSHWLSPYILKVDKLAEKVRKLQHKEIATKVRKLHKSGIFNNKLSK